MTYRHFDLVLLVLFLRLLRGDVVILSFQELLVRAHGTFVQVCSARTRGGSWVARCACTTTLCMLLRRGRLTPVSWSSSNAMKRREEKEEGIEQKLAMITTRSLPLAIYTSPVGCNMDLYHSQDDKLEE